MSIESLKNRSDLNNDELLQLMKNEKDINIYKKLNFIQLKNKGFTTEESYKLANLKKSSAYITLNQWNQGGYNALLRKSGGGRRPKLNNEQLKELKKDIQTNDLNSESKIQKYIKNKWDEDYTLPGIKNLLKTQFNINLNEDKDSLNDLTTRLLPYLKEIENNTDETNDDLNRIIFLISREKNAEILKKLTYLLFRFLGFSNRFTSKLFSITTATGNNWLNKWKKRGYDSLKRKKGQGRKSKLTNKELKILKKTK